jgi:hypothetical protein
MCSLLAITHVKQAYRLVYLHCTYTSCAFIIHLWCHWYVQEALRTKESQVSALQQQVAEAESAVDRARSAAAAAARAAEQAESKTNTAGTAAAQ